MTDIVRPDVRPRQGGWLPADEHALSSFRTSLAGHAAKRTGKALSPPVRQLRDLVENTPILRMHLTQAIRHALMLQRTHQDIKLGYATIEELMVLIDSVMTLSLPFSTSGLVGCPINALLDWPMCMPGGFEFFQFSEVNAKLRAVLDRWSRFLDGPHSRRYLNTCSPDGWFSAEASQYVDMSLFVCDPTAPFHGFASWNDFFTRRLRPEARPVASVGDPRVVVSACESTPYQIQRHAELRDAFWLKRQRYSLRDIFTARRSDLARTFVGGTVYQAFLSAYNYHRWHAPVDGVVVEAYLVRGTYYSDVASEHLDPSGPNNSQGYITAVAARAIIVIDTELAGGSSGPGLVACVFVGMAEISSCMITVSLGDAVTKGDELGYFQYGGSTHCLIFQPRVKIEFGPKPPFNEQASIIKINSHLATVAL
jgi:phosphatidylserine decarboxylase